MNAETVEQEIQRKGLTGPRVTRESIEARIATTYFHRPPGSTLTVAVIMMVNGFTVTGESACADPANFDQALGERLARENAFNKLWALEGYLLRERLAFEPKTAKGRADREYAELVERLKKLDAFVGSAPYMALSADARSLINSQRQYMSGYASALGARLGNWTG